MFKLIYKGRVGESGFKCAIYPLCVILKRPWHFCSATFRLFLAIRSLWLRLACLPLANSGKQLTWNGEWRKLWKIGGGVKQRIGEIQECLRDTSSQGRPRIALGERSLVWRLNLNRDNKSSRWSHSHFPKAPPGDEENDFQFGFEIDTSNLKRIYFFCNFQLHVWLVFSTT